MRCGEEEELTMDHLDQEEQVSANCFGGESETSTSSWLILLPTWRVGYNPWRDEVGERKRLHESDLQLGTQRFGLKL